jgi:hypothetical protein
MLNVLSDRKVARATVQSRAQVRETRTVVIERRDIARHRISNVVNRHPIRPRSVSTSRNRRCARRIKVGAVIDSDSRAIVHQHLRSAVVVVVRPNAVDVACQRRLRQRLDPITQQNAAPGVNSYVQQIRRFIQLQIEHVSSVVQPASEIIQANQAVAVTCHNSP